MSTARGDLKSEIAASIPTDSGLSVQEELDKVSVSASPGFTWGRSGNAPAGTWLQNDTVPSNAAGRRNFLLNASVIRVFVSNETVGTFDVGVYEHTGIGTETLLGTVSIVSARGGDFTVSFGLTSGKELATRITTGSAKNPQVGCIIQGDLS